ncbi:MAG: hypothetical protein JRI97_01780 [Deltaproteobacteria bacterium]|nr:hypothetical protein [Deltaproteobacteria bacterium]
MRILFASEGFIVDGVASYNLYFGEALTKAGEKVAIAGRWAGFTSYKDRFAKAGIQVIQSISPFVDGHTLVSKGRAFAPDVIVTDSRRSFSLARKIQETTGAPLFTVFHDPPENDLEGERSMANLLAKSDAWITPERPIYRELEALSPDVPLRLIERPVAGRIHPSPLPTEGPFRVLLFGRLSGFKSPGLRAVVDNAAELKKQIPSLEIEVLGGGWRKTVFAQAAARANRRAGEKFVRVLGAQPDPLPFIQRATLVCAGATSAVEALLAQRLVLAFSGFWIGGVTTENLEYAVDMHFGERGGEFRMKEKPEAAVEGILAMHEQWKTRDMAAETALLREKLAPMFSDGLAVSRFWELYRALGKTVPAASPEN